MSKYNTNKNKYLAKSERASVPKITKKQKGSITIEAAFAIPLFLFAALCLIWMIEIQSIKIGVKQAAYSAAKSAAEDTAVIPVLNTIKLKSDIIRLLGKERIERSIIVDGSEGISCWNSYLSSKTGEMNIHVKYEVRVPLPLFGNPSAKMEETFRIHGWTGYGKDKKTEDSEIVYITEKQSVYHEDYHCSYLQLSIRFVPYEQLEEIRNENGGIYYACEKCVYGDASTGVYITENGSKYHNSLGCSGLKRTIRAVKKTEVQGLIVTSNYFVAENGVTRRSRRFSVFIGCLRDDRLGNNGNIYIVHEVEENLHFLLALAAGFVRGIDDDFLDILVHDGLCQLLHIHIFLCQGDKGIQTVVHFFPLFHPFFDNFNFEL